MSCNGCGHQKLAHRLRGNGDIHFIKKGPEPPPELKGYKRDRRDDWLFHPTALPFAQCDYAIAMQTKGGMGRMCTHPDITVLVTPDVCAKCPLRRNIKSSE